MKRLDLVQLTFIIVGVISLYFCLGLLPQFIYYMIGWFGDGARGSYVMEFLIESILMVAFYLIFSIYIIKNSKRLAESLCSKANLHGEIDLSLNKTEILYVVFIGIGIYGLIQNVPPMIKNIYQYFQGKNEMLEMEMKRPQKIDLLVQAMSIGLFFTLFYYARVFAEFAASKINNVEPPDEITAQHE